MNTASYRALYRNHNWKVHPILKLRLLERRYPMYHRNTDDDTCSNLSKLRCFRTGLLLASRIDNEIIGLEEINPDEIGNHKEKKNRKSKGEFFPEFWKSSKDRVVVCEKTGAITFRVSGNPLPLRRHRTSRGFTYNPSAASQSVFRDAVIENLQTVENFSQFFIESNKSGDEIPDDTTKVIFSDEKYLEVNLVFRMRRPRNHFRSSNPGENGGLDRLKPTSPVFLCDSRVDVDNLAKFVLDACNGLLYKDDRQVIKLGITKTYDCEGQCLGNTEVMVREVTEEDLKHLK